MDTVVPSFSSSISFESSFDPRTTSFVASIALESAWSTSSPITLWGQKKLYFGPVFQPSLVYSWKLFHPDPWYLLGRVEQRRVQRPVKTLLIWHQKNSRWWNMGKTQSLLYLIEFPDAKSTLLSNISKFIWRQDQFKRPKKLFEIVYFVKSTWWVEPKKCQVVLMTLESVV